MITFEQFISEADEMGLQSRLSSGQINPQQARILQQRRNARSKTTVKPVEKETTPTKPGKPISGAPERRALPGTANNYKPQSVLKANNDLGTSAKRKPIPNHLALSTKVKDQKKDEIQQQRNKVLGHNNKRSDVKFRKGLGNVAKNIVSQLRKKQSAPETEILSGKDLEGPAKFGPTTR